MSRIRKTATALVAAGALTAGALGMLSAPAHADGPEKERNFRVASADVDFSVDLDDGRYDIDVDVDDAKPGTRWKVVLKHNGKKIAKGTWRADRDDDGDVVDIDRTRPNTAGKDKFKLTVKQVGKKAKKSRTITMR
ncbi:hypothetical protein [Nocardioides alcanivorans]|uniref:hypothetical protein n=1 Tax=Nocardioides alcanivorans TaxID=2897352 RepID=UPI001F30E125|nr:hypothetical protein [Nocardioides alcanivorans]